MYSTAFSAASARDVSWANVSAIVYHTSAIFILLATYVFNQNDIKVLWIISRIITVKALEVSFRDQMSPRYTPSMSQKWGIMFTQMSPCWINRLMQACVDLHVACYSYLSHTPPATRAPGVKGLVWRGQGWGCLAREVEIQQINNHCQRRNSLLKPRLQLFRT